mmetsp:Transcript_105147/g.192043  ORF Transcript_105147/g.192043 Transcript_105147/m.192043 type:complete len:334 (+) Transcript_105147:65-1066(+)
MELSRERLTTAAAEEMEQMKIQSVRTNPRRGGVAAQSISEERMRDYIKPVFPKDKITQGQLLHILTSNEQLRVLCGHLDAQALTDVINAFQLVEVGFGVDIIRQGEEGDRLYIIFDGQVDIFVARRREDGFLEPGDKGAKVVTYGPGQPFGELALMYSTPRAATVTIASASAQLYALDRQDFQMLLAASRSEQYQMYNGWLCEVPILQTLNHYELARLSDVIEMTLFDTDEVIIAQGELTDRFYILEDGTCAAYMIGEHGERQVMRYELKGNYFGEVALLMGEARRASIRATGSGCSVASLSKEDFWSLLGPVAELLRPQLAHYLPYESFLGA